MNSTRDTKPDTTSTLGTKRSSRKEEKGVSQEALRHRDKKITFGETHFVRHLVPW